MPQIVFSSSLVNLGVSSPLYLFLKDICETYYLAQIRINPNDYRSMIVLYIVYEEEDFDTLDARTLGYIVYYANIHIV